jgi:hypothetical protein
MFNNGLPDSSLFCCISFLCLPHCLPAHMTCVVCSSAFYALCAISIHCIVPFLFNSTVVLSSFFTHESPSTTTTTTTPTTTPISSLYHVLIAYVHFVHAMHAIPLHTHTVSISSTSQVLFLIIATLHILWWFPPRVQHHWVLC